MGPSARCIINNYIHDKIVSRPRKNRRRHDRHTREMKTRKCPFQLGGVGSISPQRTQNRVQILPSVKNFFYILGLEPTQTRQLRF